MTASQCRTRGKQGPPGGLSGSASSVVAATTTPTATTSAPGCCATFNNNICSSKDAEPAEGWHARARHGVPNGDDFLADESDFVPELEGGGVAPPSHRLC